MTLSHWYKYMAGISFLLIAFYLNGISQVSIEKHWMESVMAPTLQDIGFDLLPELTVPNLPDYMIGVLFLFALMIFVLNVKRGLIFRRLCVTMGFVYILRFITMSVTILPNPYKKCESTDIHENIFIGALKVVIHKRTTCGDVLFSGHASAMTLFVMTFHEYASSSFRFNPTPLVVCVWVLGIMGWIIIISSRFHYTIDVLIAVLVTVTSFKIYHELARSDTYHLLEWYESSDHDVLLLGRNDEEIIEKEEEGENLVGEYAEVLSCEDTTQI
jgi:hypothetical protein